MRTLALATALAAAAIGASSTDAQTTTCPPGGARPLLRNDLALIYTFKGGVAGCSFDSSYLVPLDPGAVAKPPVMALSRDVAGTVSFDYVDGLVVEVTRLRQNGGHRNYYRPVERIGAIRVKPDLTVAFIACPPERGDDEDTNVTKPAPHCQRASRRTNRVYLAIAGGKLKRIARAAHIDPRSLRLSGTAVSWTQAGRRHTHTYR